MNNINADLLILLSLCELLLVSSALQYDCSKAEYDRCVKMADPLIKEVHLIFPDNMNDIDLVCRTWNNFVDCLKKYTERCFTDQQRYQFNKAIENPIQSVHQMCTQPNYQKEYLRYSPCMKSTVIDGARCGPYYSMLVDQVDQGDVVSKATLCCSHDRFKQCVLKETKEICDRGVEDGPAAQFSAQTIDKALSFLQDQCYNYIPNSGDCATIPTDNFPFSNTLVVSTSPSEIYPWTTIEEMAPKEILPSRVQPSRPWISTSSVPNILNTQYVSTQNLGTRTRPASYGRASSWSDSTVQNTQPGVQTFSDVPSPTSPFRPPGATMSTWTVVNPSPEIANTVNLLGSERGQVHSTLSSSTTWYPAAGSQLSNEVEEPNQLGLIRPENNAGVKAATICILVIIATVLSIFY